MTRSRKDPGDGQSDPRTAGPAGGAGRSPWAWLQASQCARPGRPCHLPLNWSDRAPSPGILTRWRITCDTARDGRSADLALGPCGPSRAVPRAATPRPTPRAGAASPPGTLFPSHRKHLLGPHSVLPDPAQAPPRPALRAIDPLPRRGPAVPTGAALQTPREDPLGDPFSQVWKVMWTDHGSRTMGTRGHHRTCQDPHLRRVRGRLRGGQHPWATRRQPPPGEEPEPMTPTARRSAGVCTKTTATVSPDCGSTCLNEGRARGQRCLLKSEAGLSSGGGRTSERMGEACCLSASTIPRPGADPAARSSPSPAGVYSEHNSPLPCR